MSEVDRLQELPTDQVMMPPTSPEDDLVFADERTAQTFYLGQKVLFLGSGYDSLIDSKIIYTEAYQSVPWVLKPLPPVELNEQQQEEEAAKLKAINARIGMLKMLRDISKIPDSSDEHSTYVGPDAFYSQELLRLEMLLIPEFQSAVPASSPGLVKIKNSQGITITDMDRNTIIPLPVWQKLKSQPGYSFEWIEHDPYHTKEKGRALLKAIIQRRREEESEAELDKTCSVFSRHPAAKRTHSALVLG